MVQHFKTRETELVEQARVARDQSASVAAHTQHDQLSAEIKRLTQSLELQTAAKTILETSVFTKDAKIKELEAEVARLKLQNSAVDNEGDDSKGSGSDSEGNYDNEASDMDDDEDAMNQVNAQGLEDATQNSKKPVVNGGGGAGILGFFGLSNPSKLSPSIRNDCGE